MGTLSYLTLALGAACNFSCAYCPRPRGAERLALDDIAAFLDLLLPRLSQEVRIDFSGGEPLLHWPLIEATVRHVRRIAGRSFRFALTTNGSLLDAGLIRALRKHGFQLGLSYDGSAQRLRDAGSVAAVESALERLRRGYPGGYVVNSVFTPRTVAHLAPTVCTLLRRGHPRLRFALDLTAAWRPAELLALQGQLGRVAAACREHRRRSGETPLENFLDPRRRGVFACSAGSDRLALLPDRSVWGCELFHTLYARHGDPAFVRHRLGGLEELLAGRRGRTGAALRARLRQDYFIVDDRRLCGLCADLERCAVCPAAAALASGAAGVIPAWLCRSQRLVRRAAAGRS